MTTTAAITDLEDMLKKCLRMIKHHGATPEQGKAMLHAFDVSKKEVDSLIACIWVHSDYDDVKLNSGKKYKGQTLLSIYQQNRQYLAWAYEHFNLDEDTLMAIKSFLFSHKDDAEIPSLEKSVKKRKLEFD